jgi:hypothetical protein
MTRVTKVIYLPYNATDTAQATISIPFNVKSVKVKKIVYSANASYTSYFYQVLTSNMFNRDEPLGIVFVGTAAGMQLTSNTEVVKEFSTPVNISGTYSFNLVNVDGTSGGSQYSDYCVLILEFLSATDDD